MKTLLTIIGLGVMLSLNSCFIGDDGPRGPQGPQGQDGVDGEEAFVFEYENVSFTGPDYELILEYASDFTALESDVTLVYFLWDIVDGSEIWRPLPQNIITADGLLQYNFDFTRNDVKLFLDAEFPLDDLTASDTDDWVVRIVVVPGKFWDGNGRREMPSYEEVKVEYNLPDLPAPTNVINRKN